MSSDEEYLPERADDPAFWRSLKDDAAVDACARLDPENALKFAALRLSPSRLDWCALRAPGHALAALPSAVSSAVFDELVSIAPAAVVRYAPGRVSRPQAEQIAMAAPEVGIQLSAQLSRKTLLWVAGRRPGDALASDAFCAALGDDTVDALARGAWDKASSARAVELVFRRAPQVLSDEEIRKFLDGEGRQSLACGGPSTRYRLALQPAVIPRLTPQHLAAAAEFHPTRLLWMGIEHLPAAVRERAISTVDPEARVDFGGEVPVSRWAQVERLPAQLRQLLTGAAPVCAAPSF